MRFFTLIACVLSVAEAAFTQSVSKNLFGFIPTSSDMDSALNLWAAGIIDASPTPQYLLARAKANKKDLQISVTPSNKGAVFTRPSSVTVVGSTVVVVSTENINIDATTSSQKSVVHGFINPVSGAKPTWAITGLPTFLGSNDVGGITINAIVPSPTDNKLFLLASCLMNAAKNAYGYSVYKIDVTSGKIDWTQHYYVPNTEGGYPNAGALTPSALWVAGVQGIVRFNVATGAVMTDNTAVLAAIKNSQTALYVEGVVIISDFNTVYSFNPTTAVQNFQAAGFGMVSPQAKGPAPGNIWFSRTLASSGDPSDWDIEVGVFSTGTMAAVARQTFNSGKKMYDAIVGVYAKGNVLNVLVNGKTTVKSGLFNMFTSTVDAIKILQYQCSSAKKTLTLINQAQTTGYGTAALYSSSASSSSVGITYNGDAIFYTDSVTGLNEDEEINVLALNEEADSGNGAGISLPLSVWSLQSLLSDEERWAPRVWHNPPQITFKRVKGL